jgi:hypothetical protein
MKNLQIFAVVLVAMTSACSTQKYHWVHPEKDALEYEADNAYCEAQTRGTKTISRMPQNTGGQAGSFSTGWSTVPVVEVMEMQKRIHRECMIDKGWRWEPE